jgi:nitrate/TMAO reductase-like tetraheme cytochrome c subunit
LNNVYDAEKDALQKVFAHRCKEKRKKEENMSISCSNCHKFENLSAPERSGQVAQPSPTIGLVCGDPVG